MQREQLSDNSWVHYDGVGALRSDYLGNGVVLHTCQGLISPEFADIVVVDGNRCLREFGRCIFMVDDMLAHGMTVEFREAVTRWLASNRSAKAHVLQRSRLLAMAIRVANLVLWQSPVLLYASAKQWEAVGAAEISGFQRKPVVIPGKEGRSQSLLVLLSVIDSSPCGVDREQALTTLLAVLRSWVPSFVHRRFGSAMPDLDDLVEDAIQHLLLAVAGHKHNPNSFINEAGAQAWCQVVIANYIRSELRRRKRISSVPQVRDEVVRVHEQIEARNTLDVLVSLLRAGVRESAGSRELYRKLALLDEFFVAMACPREQSLDRRTSNRLSQQRTRTRRFVRGVWQQLKSQRAISTDLLELACALGLEDGSALHSP